MSSQAPTIAFFGATGGVTNSVLVHALRDGAHAVALVRTPSKLTDQLKAQKVTEDVISNQLTVISGDALDVAAVKSTLTARRADYLVPQIVSGLGATPSFQFKFCQPLQLFTIDNPTLCGTAAHTLVTALHELYAQTPSLAQRKPKITFVSTTGISDGVEDVPFGMQTLYHKALAEPHKDKRVMETVFRNETQSKGNEDPVFSGVIGIRPTLLTGGIDADSGVGSEKLKIGTESKPATGFTVSRADVGAWMWFNVVGNEEKRKTWEGEMVSMTS